MVGVALPATMPATQAAVASGCVATPALPSCAFVCGYYETLKFQAVALGTGYTSAEAWCGGAKARCFSTLTCTGTSVNPTAAYGTGTCALYAGASVACGSVPATSRGPEGCSAGSGSACAVYCVEDDLLSVIGNGKVWRGGGYGWGYYEYYDVDVWADCGGVTASCSGFGYCEMQNATRVPYTTYGTCAVGGDAPASGTCHASQEGYGG